MTFELPPTIGTARSQPFPTSARAHYALSRAPRPATRPDPRRPGIGDTGRSDLARRSGV